MAIDEYKETRSMITFELEPSINGANIKVIGIGGGGGNAINRMPAAETPEGSLLFRTDNRSS